MNMPTEFQLEKERHTIKVPIDEAEQRRRARSAHEELKKAADLMEQRKRSMDDLKARAEAAEARSREDLAASAQGYLTEEAECPVALRLDPDREDAWIVHILHPSTGETVETRAPTPREMQTVRKEEKAAAKRAEEAEEKARNPELPLETEGDDCLPGDLLEVLTALYEALPDLQALDFPTVEDLAALTAAERCTARDWAKSMAAGDLHTEPPAATSTGVDLVPLAEAWNTLVEQGDVAPETVALLLRLAAQVTASQLDEAIETVRQEQADKDNGPDFGALSPLDILKRAEQFLGVDGDTPVRDDA